VSLPLFSPFDDPGPDFAGLLRRAGVPAIPTVPDSTTPFRHSTTVVALRLDRKSVV